MVNNPALFNGALVGGAGGSQERWIIDQNAASYAGLANAANVLATMVDSRISAIAGGGSIGQGQLMQSICQAILANRYLTSLNTADYAELSLAISAVFSAVNAKLQPSPSQFTITSPIYVEQYLATSGNDIRTAIRAAWIANPNAYWFILPPGAWAWPGLFLTSTDGFRNGMIIQGQNTELYTDMGGVAGGQKILFYRGDTGSTHADRIIFRDIKFSLYNALTSYFGAAVYLEAASNCKIENCEFVCTLVPAATTGRIRWGAAFLGGDQVAVPTAGTNNRFQNLKLDISQLQCCGAGRSVDGFIISSVLVNSANDYAISAVSSSGFNVKNVLVRDIVCKDVAGEGVVFLGSDGTGTGTGATLVQNLIVDGVLMDGQRNPDLDFGLQACVQIDGGIVTERVIVNNVAGSLSPAASLQSRGVLIQSQDDETRWTGLAISNCELGVFTTNDPLEALYINGRNMSDVSITNVHVRGIRGVALIDADNLTCSNVQIDDGSMLVRAVNRNLVGIQLSNVTATRTTGAFTNAIFFFSTGGRSMSRVQLSNVIASSVSVCGIGVSLAGGTMAMMLSNVENPSNSNPSAETLTGIIRFANIKGMLINTQVSVVVPAVAAGAVGYVNVSMAGTRLADLAVQEGVVVNPGAQLVAAGVGGAFVNARVQATGVVECAFLGPLAGGAVNFNFNRAN